MSKKMEEKISSPDDKFKKALEIFKEENKNNKEIEKICDELNLWRIKSSRRDIANRDTLKTFSYCAKNNTINGINQFFKSLSKDMQVCLYADYIIADNKRMAYEVFPYDKKIKDNSPFVLYSSSLHDIAAHLWKYNNEEKNYKVFITDLVTNNETDLIAKAYKKSFITKESYGSEDFKSKIHQEMLHNLKLEILSECFYEKYSDNPQAFYKSMETIASNFPNNKKESLLKECQRVENNFTKKTMQIFLNELDRVSKDPHSSSKENINILNQFCSKKHDNLEHNLMNELFKQKYEPEIKILKDRNKTNEIINEFKNRCQQSNLKNNLINEEFSLRDELILRDNDPILKQYQLGDDKSLLEVLKFRANAEYLLNEYNKSSEFDKEKILNVISQIDPEIDGGYLFNQQDYAEYLKKEKNLLREKNVQIFSLPKEQAFSKLTDKMIKEVPFFQKPQSKLKEALIDLKNGKIQKFLSSHYFDAKKSTKINELAMDKEYRKANEFASLLQGEYSKNTNFTPLLVEFVKYIEQPSPEYCKSISNIMRLAKPRILETLSDEFIKNSQGLTDIQKNFLLETKKLAIQQNLHNQVDNILKNQKQPLQIPTKNAPNYLIGPKFPGFEAFATQKSMHNAEFFGDTISGFKDIKEFKQKIIESTRNKNAGEYAYLALDAHGQNPDNNKTENLVEDEYYIQLLKKTVTPVSEMFKVIKDVYPETPIVMSMNSCFGENVAKDMKNLLPQSMIFTYGDKNLTTLIMDSKIKNLSSSYDTLSKMPDIPEPIKLFIGTTIRQNGDINTPKIHYVKKNGEVELFNPDEKIMEMAKNIDAHRESLIKTAKIIGIPKEQREDFYTIIRNRVKILADKNIFKEPNLLKQELMKEPKKKDDIEDFKQNFYFVNEEAEKYFDYSVRNVEKDHHTENWKNIKHEHQIIGLYEMDAQKAVNIHTALMVAATLEECKESKNNPEHFMQILTKKEQKPDLLQSELDKVNKDLANKAIQKLDNLPSSPKLNKHKSGPSIS